MGNFLEKIDELGVGGCKRIFWAGVAARGKLGRLGNAQRPKVCVCPAVLEREREGHGTAVDQGRERRRLEELKNWACPWSKAKLPEVETHGRGCRKGWEAGRQSPITEEARRKESVSTSRKDFDFLFSPELQCEYTS